MWHTPSFYLNPPAVSFFYPSPFNSQIGRTHDALGKVPKAVLRMVLGYVVEQFLALRVLNRRLADGVNEPKVSTSKMLLRLF